MRFALAVLRFLYHLNELWIDFTKNIATRTVLNETKMTLECQYLRKDSLVPFNSSKPNLISNLIALLSL